MKALPALESFKIGASVNLNRMRVSILATKLQNAWMIDLE